MDPGLSRCVRLSSVAGGRPDTGRNRSGSSQIVSVQRVGLHASAFHHRRLGGLQFGAQPDTGTGGAAGQCGPRLAPAIEPHPDRRPIRHSPAAGSGADRGSDSAGRWLYLHDHYSGSIGVWPHGSRPRRGTAARPFRAAEGSVGKSGTQIVRAPTTTHLGGQVNDAAEPVTVGPTWRSPMPAAAR